MGTTGRPSHGMMPAPAAGAAGQAARSRPDSVIPVGPDTRALRSAPRAVQGPVLSGGPPPPARIWALTVIAWEVALSTRARDGAGPVPADVAWAVAAAAVAAPATAARAQHVRATLPPQVRAAVLAAAGASQRLAGQASQRAGWQAVGAGSSPAVSVAAGEPADGTTWLSAAQAARVADRHVHAIRAACRRGRLAAVKDDAGRWRITPAAIEAYQARR